MGTHTRVRPPYNPHGDLTRSEQTRERAIARNRVSGPGTAQAVQGKLPITITRPDDPASDGQKGYIEGLIEKLNHLDPVTAETASTWYFGRVEDGCLVGGVKRTMNKELAHRTIDRLKLRIEEAQGQPSMPDVDAKLPTPPADLFADVPDGYYAVVAEEGHLAFYRVSTWRDSGRRSVQVQASDSWFRLKGRAAADAILRKIREATPVVAGKAYADAIGSCYVCNRTLTDELSRSLGIGPVCRTKQ